MLKLSATYNELVDLRDRLEQPVMLKALITNSIVQNKLIADLQSSRSPSSLQPSPSSDLLVKELSDKIQPLQEQLFKEKQTNTQLARQVIKFTEDLDRLDRELRSKEKEFRQLKADVSEQYVRKEEAQSLRQTIENMNDALKTQTDESMALRKTIKVLEDKLMKTTQEKEYYLTEVLTQKAKQAEFLDQVNQIESQANQTRILLA